MTPEQTQQLIDQAVSGNTNALIILIVAMVLLFAWQVWKTVKDRLSGAAPEHIIKLQAHFDERMDKQNVDIGKLQTDVAHIKGRLDIND